MRSMILRRDPGSILDQMLQSRYGPRPMVYGNEPGTRKNPTRLTRGHWVEREYDTWEDPDGSYHEELVKADDVASDLPENYGGTD